MLTPHQILYAAMAAGIGYLLVKAYMWVDGRVETRRREAIKLASTLQANGLGVVADFLTDYAVGDYDGLAAKLIKFRHLTSNDAALRAEVISIAKAILGGQLNTVDGKVAVAKMFVDLGPAVQSLVAPAAVLAAAPLKAPGAV